MASSKNFCMSLTSFGVDHFNNLFIFFSFILIPSSPITTPRNPIFLTFYLHFSSFAYRLFSTDLFTASFATSLYPSSFSILTIISSMKLVTSLVLIKSYRISFIIIWNIVRELVSPKNITIGSNDPFGS